MSNKILNEGQKDAIVHKDGPMMVLAGPGSGKTFVIVNRLLNLINNKEVAPEEILVVTFSKASATEMKERYLKEAKVKRTDIEFGTFHRVFFKILCSEYKIDYRNILRPDEKENLIKNLCKTYVKDFSQDEDLVSDIEKEISNVKNNQIDIEHYYSASCPTDIFKKIYASYIDALKEHRKIDFDDMLVFAYKLFTQKEDILKKWQKKYKYILVDEFQDINYLQYKLVKMLAMPLNNLFIVGDDDQSIYSFRGAKPQIMLNFPKEYKNAKIVKLNVNYRCGSNILDCGLKLINKNNARYKKELVANNKTQKPIRVLSFNNPREEYLQCISEIKKEIKSEEDYNKYCCLIRTNQEAEGLIGAFIENMVPFVMKEAIPNIFNHWICKDILTYFEVANGKETRENLLKIINKPNRYISREAFISKDTTINDLIKYYEKKDWIVERLETLQTYLKIIKTLKPSAAINFIRNTVDYNSYLEEYARYRKLPKEDLLEIIDFMYENSKSCDTYEELLVYIKNYEEKLKENIKNNREKPQGVLISTLHGAKGLEFDNVYILNAFEGNMPYKKATLDQAIEEERRLFYVGITRAKKSLTIAHVKKYYDKDKIPSRFIKEAGL